MHPDHADDRRGGDVLPVGLVVEADVATDDRGVEGATRLGHTVDSFGQLPHHLRVLGVAEVEAVDDRQRAGADAGDVHHRLGHDHRCALSGIDVTPPMVAIGGQPEAPAGLVSAERVAKPEEGPITAGTDDGVEEQLVVVLAVHPARVADEREQICTAVDVIDGTGVRRAASIEIGGPLERAVVLGRIIVQRAGRHVGEHLAVEPLPDPKCAIAGDPADHRGRHLPLLAEPENLVEVVWLNDGQHPLL